MNDFKFLTTKCIGRLYGLQTVSAAKNKLVKYPEVIIINNILT